MDDPSLEPYQEKIHQFAELVNEEEKKFCQEAGSLEVFSSGHDYFGLHFYWKRMDFP